MIFVVRDVRFRFGGGTAHEKYFILKRRWVLFGKIYSDANLNVLLLDLA